MSRLTPEREAEIRNDPNNWLNTAGATPELLREIDAMRADRAAEKANLRDALRSIRRGCDNPNCDCSSAIANRIIDKLLKE